MEHFKADFKQMPARFVPAERSRYWIQDNGHNCTCYLMRGETIFASLSIPYDGKNNAAIEVETKAEWARICDVMNGHSALRQKAVDVLNLAPASTGEFAQALHLLSEACGQ